MQGSEFRASSVATAWHTLARLTRQSSKSSDKGPAQRNPELVERLVQMARESAGDFNALGVSNMLWSLAHTSEEGHGELIKKLVVRAMSVAGTFKSQHVANSLWALDKLGLNGELVLIRSLGRRGMEISDEFNPYEVSIALSALARMEKVHEPGLVEALLQRGVELARGDHEFKPPDVANSLRALALLGGGSQEHRDFLDVLCVRAQQNVPAFAPLQLANVTWSLAKLEAKDQVELIQALATRAGGIAESAMAKDVAESLWALAKLEARVDQATLIALAQRGAETASDLVAHDIANSLWALATLGFSAESQAVPGICQRGHETAQDFRAEDVAVVLWALATMQTRGETAEERSLIEDMERKGLDLADELSPAEASTALWALAALRKDGESPLVRALVARIVAQRAAASLQPQELSNLFWALATMGVCVEAKLVAALGRRACTTAGRFQANDVTKLLWALACVDLAGLDFHFVLLDSMATRCLQLRSEFHPSQKRLLHQWFLSCEIDPTLRRALPESVSRAKSLLGSDFRLSYMASRPLDSELKMEVAVELRAMLPDLEVEVETVDEPSGYTIDICVQNTSDARQWTTGAYGLLPERVWAVEVDEEFHFLEPHGLMAAGRTEADFSRHVDGKRLLKRKHLLQLGYTVASVSCFEWKRLGSAGDPRRRDYLEKLLKAAAHAEGATPVADALSALVEETGEGDRLHSDASNSEGGALPAKEKDAVDNAFAPPKQSMQAVPPYTSAGDCAAAVPSLLSPTLPQESPSAPIATAAATVAPLPPGSPPGSPPLPPASPPGSPPFDAVGAAAEQTAVPEAALPATVPAPGYVWPHVREGWGAQSAAWGAAGWFWSDGQWVWGGGGGASMTPSAGATGWDGNAWGAGGWVWAAGQWIWAGSGSGATPAVQGGVLPPSEGAMAVPPPAALAVHPSHTATSDVTSSSCPPAANCPILEEQPDEAQQLGGGAGQQHADGTSAMADEKAISAATKMGITGSEANPPLGDKDGKLPSPLAAGRSCKTRKKLGDTGTSMVEDSW